jgi:hypothetical protein
MAMHLENIALPHFLSDWVPFSKLLISRISLDFSGGQTVNYKIIPHQKK